MSEQGWKGFVNSDVVDDWVVLHGGATAVFKVESLGESARLAEALAEVAGEDQNFVMTVASDRLTVRLTRDVWQLEEAHIELAREVSAKAREFGLRSDRSAVQEVQLAIAAQPDEVDLGFWQAVLGYAQTADDSAVDPLGHSSTVWMQELNAGKPLRHAMHLDVSLAREEAEDRLAQAVPAGGRIVDDSEAPRWWTLADKAGNRVCIASWPDGAGANQPSP